jgi:DNA-binding SARP family transcriptional activator/tetratricopeptide (TPR) repeat protein
VEIFPKPCLYFADIISDGLWRALRPYPDVQTLHDIIADDRKLEILRANLVTQCRPFLLRFIPHVVREIVERCLDLVGSEREIGEYASWSSVHGGHPVFIKWRASNKKNRGQPERSEREFERRSSEPSAREAHDTVEIRLFGRVEVVDRRRGGTSASSLPAASKSLLVWLLLHRGEAASRQAVAFALFPEETEEAAFANLRRHIHTLSRKLSEIHPDNRWIIADHQNIAWNAALPLELDLDTFVEAAQTQGLELAAATVYRGELAADVSDAWVEPYRNQLRDQFAAACLLGAEFHYCKDEHAVSQQLLQAYLFQEPWHEEALRALILIKARSGDRLGALQRFETFREELARELSVEPSAKLLSAVVSIRDDRYEAPFAESRDAEGAAISTAKNTHALGLHMGSYSFRGRDQQVQLIMKALTDSAPAGVIVVAGEAGIGKSRLAKEVAYIMAQRGARTFNVSCTFESRRPYGSIRELFEWPESRTREELWLAIVYELNRLGGERSALIVIDDAQWADAATLEFLRALKTLRSPLPSFIMLYRAGCGDAKVDVTELQTIADLFVELGPLDRDVLKAIVADTIQGREPAITLLESISDSSEGNPLLAQELARYSMLKHADPRALRLPASVAASVHRRLSDFNTEELGVLEAAAVIGSTFSIAVLKNVARVPESSVRRVLRKARDLGFLKSLSGPEAMSFAHDVFREEILSRLLVDERVNLHRVIATGLLKYPEQGELLADLAYHWQEAGEFFESAKAFVAAGDHARAVYALRDALDYYECALRQNCADSQLRLAIEAKRAETLLAQGLLDEARHAFEMLLERIESTHDVDPAFRATILLRLSACEWTGLRRRASVLWATRALEAAGEIAACDPQRAEANVMLARAAVLRGDADEALEYLHNAGEVSDPDLQLSIAGYRGLAHGMLGHEHEALEAVTAPTAKILECSKDVAVVAAFRQNQAISIGWFGRVTESRPSFDAVVSIGKRARNGLIEAIGNVGLGHVLYYMDALHEARKYYDIASALAGEAPNVATFYCAALGLKIAAATGDRKLAEQLINERLFVLCEESDDVLFVNTLTGALIDYSAAFGEVERARLLLKSYLATLKVGSGLVYVIPSLVAIGDESDTSQALTLARAWTASGDNLLGKAFTAMLSGAPLTAIPIFERLGMLRFIGVAETLTKSTPRMNRAAKPLP